MRYDVKKYRRLATSRRLYVWYNIPMPLLLELVLGGLALFVVAFLIVANRFGNKTSGEAVAVRMEHNMALAKEVQALYAEMVASTSDSRKAEIQKRIAAIQAELAQQSQDSVKNFKKNATPMLAMNFAMAGIAVLFALGAMGYLLYAQFNWIYVGALVVILALIAFGSSSLKRWWRIWNIMGK